MVAKKYEQLVAGLQNGVVRELMEERKKSESEAKRFARGIILPTGENSMEFICDGNTVRIIMSMEGAGYQKQLSGNRLQYVNMQDNIAAFEGWGLALHVHLNKNIRLELDTKGEAVPAWDREKLHYNRFLYRLKKFDTLYGGPDGWFAIEEDLSKAVEDFDRYLHTPGITFCNNVSYRPANVRSTSEAQVEAAFADHPDLLRAYSMDLSRQLPMGLFEGTAEDKNGVFPGDGADVDLWGLNKAESRTQLVIYELKAKRKQVGIISELMFYANYAYDMYVEEKNFKRSPAAAGSKDPRGYRRLAEAAITGIRAFMLTDALHPLITPNVLKAMNCGKIRYGALKYEWNLAKKREDIVIHSVKNCF